MATRSMQLAGNMYEFLFVHEGLFSLFSILMTQTHSFCDMKKQKTDKTGLRVDKKNRLAFQKNTNLFIFQYVQ